MSYDFADPEQTHSFAAILASMSGDNRAVPQPISPIFTLLCEPENTTYGRRWCSTPSRSFCPELTVQVRNSNHFDYKKRLTSSSFAVFLISFRTELTIGLKFRCFISVNGTDYQLRMHNRFNPIPGVVCPILVNIDLPKEANNGKRMSIISGVIRFEIWDSQKCLQVQSAGKVYSLENRKGPKQVKRVRVK